MLVHLRSWSSADAEALGEIYSRADADLLSNIPDDRTAAGAAAWIEQILAAEAEGAAHAFAIVRDGAVPGGEAIVGDGVVGDGAVDDAAAVGDGAVDDAAVGDAAVGNARATGEVGGVGDGAIVGNVMAASIERRHSSAWVSYWLAASARGQGLASSALRTLVDALHDDLGIYRLEIGYRANNPASGAVARAAGFLVEGRQRDKLLYDGIRYDTEVAARLSGDLRLPGRRLPLERSPS